jgi:hypothetical protein
MRLERDGERRAPGLAGPRHDRFQNLAMAEVHPVEVADRPDPAAGQVGGTHRIADDLHEIYAAETIAPATS